MQCVVVMPCAPCALSLAHSYAAGTRDRHASLLALGHERVPDPQRLQMADKTQSSSASASASAFASSSSSAR